ncbi:meprin A subunit alpha-like [Polypterus senegalus]|uniref:meprin A subunit alpha-like n=1 Tax=Polypterus senegalus TaxID=55291 RepID=UPI0019643700|nr:meprin A subunit alpha-like [Polypterus senegalus]
MSFLVFFWFSGLLSTSATFTQRYLPGDKVFAIDEEQKPFGIPYLNLGSKKELFEGDIAIPNGRNALRNITYRWKFPIPYILGDSLDLNAKGAVFQAFEMYRLKSCVDFKPYEGEKTFIKFEKLDGCWSFVGDLQTGQELSLGDGCDHKAVIEHELLHALGFYHEQSRTDRDDYVNIHWEEVQQGKEHNFVKYDDSFITDQNTPYDYESIMHYGPYSFNKNVSAPTVTCKIPEFDNIIGQYLDFSNMDIIRLNRMYNCSSSLTLLDHCAFESINICGMIQSSKDDEDWVHIKSISGMDDHTLLGQCRGDSSWKIAHVPFQATSKFRYLFQGVKGNPAQSNGGIYIDDINLVETRCPSGVWQIKNFTGFLLTSPSESIFKALNSIAQKGIAMASKFGVDDGALEWPVVNRQASITVLDQDPDIRMRMSSSKSFTTSLTQGDSSWKIAHVPFQATSKFRYLFQGVKGNPAQSNGGIYIDDINLVETRCPSGVWQIKNFTGFLLTSPSGEYIQSPQFYSPEGYSYGIQVVPNSSYKGYTGIFFHLFSGVDDGALEWPVVNRQASITVLDQDPDIRMRMSSSKSFTTSLTQDADGNFNWDNPSKNGKYDSNCQCYKSGTWGWRAFISHYDLHRRNYLKNDDLIVFVDFEDLTPLIKTEVTLSGLSPENELHNKV